MILEMIAPTELKPNRWNTNHLTPEAELKLQNSIERHNGLFKPIIARKLPDDSLEIIGGEHRNDAAIRLGMTSVPVIILEDVSDDRAKEIGVLDNGRYGQDDAADLSRLLSELGDIADLASFMPFEMRELEVMAAATKIDLDALDLGEEDAPEIATETPPRIPKSHAVMRIKVPIEDHSLVEDTIKTIISDQSLVDSDSLVNAGDAVIWLIRRWFELEKLHGAE